MTFPRGGWTECAVPCVSHSPRRMLSSSRAAAQLRSTQAARVGRSSLLSVRRKRADRRLQRRSQGRLERPGLHHFQLRRPAARARADLDYDKFTFKNDLPFTPMPPYVTPGLAGFNIETNLSDGQAEPRMKANQFRRQRRPGHHSTYSAPRHSSERRSTTCTDEKFISNMELKALQFVSGDV